MDWALLRYNAQACLIPKWKTKIRFLNAWTNWIKRATQATWKKSAKARNAGLLGINTYALPLLKFYEYTKKISLKSLKSIDEVLLAEFLSVYTGGLSLATKKNYRIALLGLFSYIDKQNQDENEKSYIYNITLKNISGVNQSAGNKLPTHLNNEELEKF